MYNRLLILIPTLVIIALRDSILSTLIHVSYFCDNAVFVVYNGIISPGFVSVIPVIERLRCWQLIQYTTLYGELVLFTAILFIFTLALAGRHVSPHLSLRMTLFSARICRRWGRGIRFWRYGWPLYLLFLAFSCLVTAISYYGGDLVRIITAALLSYGVFLFAFISHSQSILALLVFSYALILSLLIIVDILITLYPRYQDEFHRIPMETRIVKSFTTYLVAIPFITVLIIAAVLWDQVVQIIGKIFSEIAAVFRFISYHYEGIILVFVILIILRWIIERHHITRIEDITVMNKGEKSTLANDLDEAIKNEIGRIKQLYLDQGPFRDLESVASGDFRMFLMTDDPIATDLQSISGSIKLNSVLSIPVNCVIGLVNIFFAAPRIFGNIVLQKEGWQIYISYQDGWKSYAWRIEPDDIRQISLSPPQDETPAPADEPGTENETGASSESDPAPAPQEETLLDTITGLIQTICKKTDQAEKKEETPVQAAQDTYSLESCDHVTLAKIITAKILVILSHPGTPRWEAFYWYNEGLRSYRQALREGRDQEKKTEHLDGAACHFITALSFDDQFSDAYYHIGLVMHELKNPRYYSCIHHYFDLALKNQPFFWKAEYGKMILSITQLIGERRKKETGKADTWTDEDKTRLKLFSLYSDHPYSDNADPKRYDTDWESAGNTCYSLIRGIPDRPELYYWKAIIEYNRGRFDEMQHAIQTALALYTSEYRRCGLFLDLYADDEGKDQLYRSCLHTNYAFLTICREILKNSDEIRPVVTSSHPSGDSEKAKVTLKIPLDEFSQARLLLPDLPLKSFIKKAESFTDAWLYGIELTILIPPET